MKISWHDFGIGVLLIVLVALPSFGNNQAYGRVDGKDFSFSGDLKQRKLFYPIRRDTLIPMEINSVAYSSVVVDPDMIDKDKILLKKDISVELPMASITKLMTAIVAVMNYDMDDEITIADKDLFVDGDMDPLEPGQTFKVRDILTIMLVNSNNGAAEAIARKMGRDTFIGKMNQAAASMGLDKTEYLNPSGLDIDSVNNTNVTSLEDLTHLTVKIMNDYPVIVEILSNPVYAVKDTNNNTYQLHNTNLMLSDDKRVIWGKTGFTLKAKGCLVLVSKPLNFSFSEKRYIITIVLGSDDRFEDMRKIRSWQDNQFIW